MSFYDAQERWVAANPSVTRRLSHKQALNLISRVCKRHRLRVPALLLEPRMNPERTGGNYGDGVISVPAFPVESWIVWHELSHHGHDTRARVKDTTQHGPGFRRWYVRIVGAEAGSRVAGRLEDLLG